jgi:phosphoribosylanthranilate isomerase
VSTPSERIGIKICCMSSKAEIEEAVEAGADMLGFVSAMPSGPGVVDDDRLGELVARVPPTILPVLLTARRGVEEIVDQVEALRPGAVQLVAPVDGGTLGRLRERIPGVRLIPVVHVTGPEAAVRADEVARHADLILLDSGRPGAPVPELGGTGRTHDWSLSARIVRASPVPVILAGGLHPGNVGEAVQRVGPWGVDVCTGVRAGSRIDPPRLRSFVSAARGRALHQARRKAPSEAPRAASGSARPEDSVQPGEAP